ncbi:MAG: PAC2 family protein [Candidatus Odinarchaeia archaeon]
MHFLYEDVFYIREKKKVNADSLVSPICIQGLPGIALAGKSALDYMVRGLNAELVSEIYFYDLPPQVFVDEGKMELPKTSLYLWKDPNKIHDILFLTGDAQPVSHIGANILSEIFTEYLSKFKINLLITLGASAVQVPVKEPRIFVSATSSKLIKELTTIKGVYPFKEGLITGMNGLTPGFIKSLSNIDGCVLLVEACRYLESDLNASKFLIKALNDYLNLNVDLTELDKAVRKIETQLEELRKREAEIRRRRESGAPTYIG